MSIKVSLDNYRTIIDIQDIEKVRSIFLNIITDSINSKKLNQKNAAKFLGIDQPKISHIKNGKISGFSLERLLKFLRVLEYEINICINRK
ncbi:MAG: XRE family transcriptional regulator [Rickettsiaceae bacterium H1]|nr:XRE family transcriptional regulator [Rickettsiaceae bacterium H1]